MVDKIEQYTCTIGSICPIHELYLKVHSILESERDDPGKQAGEKALKIPRIIKVISEETKISCSSFSGLRRCVDELNSEYNQKFDDQGVLSLDGCYWINQPGAGK